MAGMPARCFFIGHRDAPASLFDALRAAVERHAGWGVGEFIVGSYGSFDAMAARAVIAAKANYPGIRLTLLCPYHPAQRPVELPPGFDGALYPFEEKVPPRFAISRANEAAIRLCDHLIAYAVHPGNARDFLEYALRRQRGGLIRVENLGDA